MHGKWCIIFSVENIPRYLSVLADVLGVLGFIITIITWNNTRKITDAMTARRENSEFREKGERAAELLKNYANSIQVDGLYTKEFLIKVLQHVESIEINYPSPTKRIKSELRKLEKNLKDCINHLDSDPNYMKAIIGHDAAKLAMQIEKLAKEAQS